MKSKRSDRLIDMTNYLLSNPHTLIPLNFFSQRYQSAKSSISEDLTILKRNFVTRNIGIIETVAGVSGGVKYIPQMAPTEIEQFLYDLCKKISDEKRLLPGGYVYLSDLLGDPQILNKIGKIIATKYGYKDIDAVLTVATKGIPLAQTVSHYLNVPFVVARRDSKITEGSTVNVNYISGSSERIEKMELSKRSLPKGSNVLIVDDFMKGGGTVNGMKSMIEEFESNVAGVVVFAESTFKGRRMVDQYTSLLCVEKVDVASKNITVVPGNYLKGEISK